MNNSVDIQFDHCVVTGVTYSVDVQLPENWAPVSEPGFLNFQIFRFSIIEFFVVFATYFQTCFAKQTTSRTNNLEI